MALGVCLHLQHSCRLCGL